MSAADRLHLDSVSRVSSLAAVAAGVSAYSAYPGAVHVERWKSGWRWSPAHRGGPQPLLREFARFLDVAPGSIWMPFNTDRKRYAYVPPRGANGRQPEAHDVLVLDTPVTPTEARALIEARLSARGGARGVSPVRSKR